MPHGTRSRTPAPLNVPLSLRAIMAALMALTLLAVTHTTALAYWESSPQETYPSATAAELDADEFADDGVEPRRRSGVGHLIVTYWEIALAVIGGIIVASIIYILIRKAFGIEDREEVTFIGDDGEVVEAVIVGDKLMTKDGEVIATDIKRLDE